MSMDDKTTDGEPLKPQVIDLEAEDVTPEPEAAETRPPPTPPPPPKHRPRPSTLWVVVAALAGLTLGGWIYRDVLSSYFPSGAMTAMEARIAAMEINHKALNEEIATFKQDSQAAAGDLAGLDASVKTSAAGLRAIEERIGAFESRAGQSEKALAAARTDLDALRKAVSSAGAASGTADPAALAAIIQRLDGLEKDVASLKPSGDAAQGAEAMASLSQALADLKAKIAAGAPFKDEYERIARMVPAAAGLDVLAPVADAGLPGAMGLAAELRALIPSLPTPSAPAPAPEPGYGEWLLSGLSGILTIRDMAATDWPALAEKSAALAAGGDLTGAIGVIDRTEGDKPAAVLRWRDRAALRLKLDAAVEQVSQSVLRQLGVLGAAP